MAKKITVLEPTSSAPGMPELDVMKREKVAAYARVSTDHEEQQSSLAAQTDYYKKKILANPGWEFAGIYADDGLSGTSYHRREAFNRMVQDCRDGKITMILTKSISRFARNTVDSIKVIRELKALNIGVMFEKENIWTLDSKGEFLLTIMSSLAQEESRSLSENVSWGHRKRMADGNYSVAFGRFLGYDQGKNGEFVINEEEARTVKWIYALTLQGYSSRAIARKLEDAEIPAPGGGESWHAGTIVYICSNEKYKGDALLQKTFTADFLTKTQKKNNGELPQYYVKSGHPAIIDPDLFDHLQEVLMERSENPSKFSGMDPYSDRFICGNCHDHYGLRPWHTVDHVWVCRTRGRKGQSCGNIHIHEYAFHFFVKQVMTKVLKNHPMVMYVCSKLIEEMIDDDERKETARKFLKKFERRSPDNITEGDEPLYIIKAITAYADNRLVFETIDGQTITHKCRQYSPARGWWEEKPEQVKPPKRIDPVVDEGLPVPRNFPENSPHLTQEQKKWIGILRARGMSYEETAKTVKANVNTIKSYCRRHLKEETATSEAYPDMIRVNYTLCPYCQRKVMQIPGRKEKRFCSDTCRNRWWNENSERSNGASLEEYTCPTCGKKFKAYPHRKRKYCCHDCYIIGRFGDGKENDTGANEP